VTETFGWVLNGLVLRTATTAGDVNGHGGGIGLSLTPSSENNKASFLSFSDKIILKTTGK
jgi:hypothetical protein